MWKKVVVMSLLMVSCARPAGAENQQSVVISNGQTTESSTQKYHSADDFLYEEKIVDILVEDQPTTGEVIENMEDYSSNEDQELQPMKKDNNYFPRFIN